MTDPADKWRDYVADDLHFVPAAPPENNPFAQADIPVVILDEETDSEEEDPEEVDPGEDSEEYVPYGHAGEYDSDTGTEEIRQDSQDPEEGIVEEEETVSTPHPQPVRHCHLGKIPMDRQAAFRSACPATAMYVYGLDSISQWGITSHYEVGGPSQVPSPAVASSLPPAVASPLPPAVVSSPLPAPAVSPPRDAPTMDQHNHMDARVLQLGDRVAADSDALQTLYCRVGAEHSHAITTGARIRALEYQLEVAKQELRAAERERLQMRTQLVELTRFVRRRLG